MWSKTGNYGVTNKSHVLNHYTIGPVDGEFAEKKTIQFRGHNKLLEEKIWS